VVASVTSFASYRNTPPTSHPRHGTVSDDCSKEPAVCAGLWPCQHLRELLARALTVWSAAPKDNSRCYRDAFEVPCAGIVIFL